MSLLCVSQIQTQHQLRTTRRRVNHDGEPGSMSRIRNIPVTRVATQKPADSSSTPSRCPLKPPDNLPFDCKPGWSEIKFELCFGRHPAVASLMIGARFNLIRCRLSSSVWMVGVVLGLLFPQTSPALIFHATGDPAYNTTTPTGELAGSGWELQGRWRSFLGTPIARNLFITAKHVGGAPGELFSFQGTDYTVIEAFADPQSDLRIFKVCGLFPAYASLYSRSDELGKPVVLFGRGTRRGAEVQGPTLLGEELKGWRWATPDGVMRWGENVVTTNVAAGLGTGPLLGLDFNANGGPNEAHFSSGDSGGAVFIEDDGEWKLAGINYAVDGPFNTTSEGAGFNAALFDAGGMFVTNSVTGGWDELPESPLDLPSAAYATRVSSRLDWINSIITEHALESLVPVLESTEDLGVRFAEHQGYAVDEPGREISLPAPAGANLFLRLRGCLPYEILSSRQGNGEWIIKYAP